jgi:hypothetical protein
MMPTFVAAVLASVAGWIAASAIRPVAGDAASLLVSLVLSSVTFLFAKRVVTELRDG